MPRARLVKIGDKVHIQTQRVSRKEKLQYMDWDWMPKLEHPVILKEIERTPSLIFETYGQSQPFLLLNSPGFLRIVEPINFSPCI